VRIAPPSEPGPVPVLARPSKQSLPTAPQGEPVLIGEGGPQSTGLDSGGMVAPGRPLRYQLKSTTAKSPSDEQDGDALWVLLLPVVVALTLYLLG
jgi:hypothetical protein